MLTLVILALMATGSFFALAKRNGFYPGKAASLPFYCLGVLMIASHLGTRVIETGLSYVNTSAGTDDRIVAMFNLFLLCLCIATLRKSWLALEDASC